MRNIIIDYLMHDDYQKPAYKAATADLSRAHVIKCQNYADLLQTFINLGAQNEDTVITIMGHAHARGLSKGTGDSLVTWAELINSVNYAKGNSKLVLNLLAVCNTYLIEDWTSFCNHNINEFWVTQNQAPSIKKAILASQAGSFDSFFYSLEEEDQQLYKSISLNAL
ncbi:hypothetical protein [Flavobacterium ginsenosidimutans]|uniref:hypothetical protein n=1 Tax=Flavobacterium ginsenosidimutans TaxID=687844 RepID=UPI003D992E68